MARTLHIIQILQITNCNLYHNPDNNNFKQNCYLIECITYNYLYVLMYIIF